MIEVERKFLLNPGEKEKLIEGATLVWGKTIHDQYFDTSNLDLIPNEIFLRLRDGRYELKLPQFKVAKKQPDAYRFEELEDDDQIRKALKLPNTGDMAADASSAGYEVVANYKTKRAKYSREGFALDFDETDFGYDVLEIEVMVEKLEEMQLATESILAFSKKFELSEKRPISKLHEYLRIKRPELFKKLEEAWSKLPAE